MKDVSIVYQGLDTMIDELLDLIAARCGGERCSSGFTPGSFERDIQFLFENRETATHFREEVQKQIPEVKVIGPL